MKPRYFLIHSSFLLLAWYLQLIETNFALGEDAIISSPLQIGASEILEPTSTCPVISGLTNIHTEAEFQDIANNLGGDYIVCKDLTLSPAFTTIGDWRGGFTGTLNGNGHYIFDLRRPLFSSIESGAKISNLKIVSPSISATSGPLGTITSTNQGTISAIELLGEGTIGAPQISQIGGIAGINNGLITTVSVGPDIKIVGLAEVGGIAGKATTIDPMNLATISNSFSSAQVDAVRKVGGILGNGIDAQLKFLTNVGLVTAKRLNNSTCESYYVGGIVGYLGGAGEIKRSKSFGDVDSCGSRVGGLVGGRLNGPGRVFQSSAYGVVKGSDYVGGIIGIVKGDTTDALQVTEVASLNPRVSGYNGVGGAVGYLQMGSLNNSYSQAEVFCSSMSFPGCGALVGTSSVYQPVVNSLATGAVHPALPGVNFGLVGWIGNVSPAEWEATIQGSFFNADSNPLALSHPGGAGKSEDELRSLQTFENAGWSISTGNVPATWIFDLSQEAVPELQWIFSERRACVMEGSFLD